MHSQRKVNYVGRVSRPKLLGPGTHAGVVLPDGRVAHMQQTGVQLTSLADFAQGRLLKFDKAVPADRHHQVQWRAQMSIGNTSPYDLLNRNCEHYASWLTDGKPESPQVNALVFFALAGAFMWASQ
jgi:hypothetical protein